MNTSLYKVALSKSFSWDAAKQINALVGGTRGSGKSFFALGALVQLASFPRFDESKLLGIGTLPTQFLLSILKIQILLGWVNYFLKKE